MKFIMILLPALLTGCVARTVPQVAGDSSLLSGVETQVATVTRQALDGDPGARVLYARWLAETGSVAQARSVLTPLAEQGNAQAQYRLGCLLMADRDRALANLKQQMAEHNAGATDLKQQLTDLRQQLATEKEARAEQTEELLALKRMTADVPLDTSEQKQAYASGVAFADMVTRSLRMQKSLGTEQPVDTVLAGITDAMKHRYRLDSKQIQTLNGKLYARLEARMKEQQEKAAREKAAQEKVGADWYARYRKKVGVKELRPGVLYRVITPGKGGGC
ncbi:hypothetical protein GU769_10265 [Escherichia coli]|nr:hypothetical protein [Escherichia coli]